jgi:hypothetical protein
VSITVTLAVTSVGPVTGDNTSNGIITVVNNGANTITVQSMQVSDLLNSGTQFRQPDFLTPNVAPGVGVPSIATSGTAYFPFSFTPFSPATPGASANAPNAMHGNAFPSSNNIIQLVCNVVTNDATAGANVIGTSPMVQIAVGTSTVPLVFPLGGSLIFNAPMDAVNWFFF